MSARKGYKAKAKLESIWTNVYAAAYVADFERMRNATRSFDQALEDASAEAAETIADRAVQEWISWNEEGR